MINARKAQLMTQSYEKYVLGEEKRSFERRVDAYFVEMYTTAKQAFDRGISGSANTGQRFFEKRISYRTNDSARVEAVKRTLVEIRKVLVAGGFTVSAKQVQSTAKYGTRPVDEKVVSIVAKW